MTYRVAPAEASGVAPQSCAAVTVAQALHWFDLGNFYQEVRRILRPDGVLAAWAYNYLHLSPDVDALVRHYHDEIVGPFWPPERKLVGRGYLQLPFPFEEIEPPPFQIEVHWSLEQLLGYLGTWSATLRYVVEKQRDPVDLIVSDLSTAWGDSALTRPAYWPLTVRLGRV